MANEISLTASLTAYKPSVMGSAVSRAIAGALFTMAGNLLVAPQTILVPFSGAIAVPLGQITAPHWSWWNNNDTTNYLTLFNGATGAVFARLYPGEQTPIPLDPTCVPYVLANTAAVYLEYMILSL